MSAQRRSANHCGDLPSNSLVLAEPQCSRMRELLEACGLYFHMIENRFSVPIPKFATARRTPGSELRDRRTLEPISKSPEEDEEASELDEAEEVLRIELPAHQQASAPLNPGEEAFYHPAPCISAEPSAILCERVHPI